MASDTKSKVISLRLRPELALEFKTEAAKRGLKLNVFFEELLRSYQKWPELEGKAGEGKKGG